MTENREDLRADRPETPCVPQLPRLFSEADASAVEGAFDGAEGVGGADERGEVERPLHGGARRPASADHDRDHAALSTLLDTDWPGVRGASPATRQELAELILRYREEQASRRARRLAPEPKKARF